MIEGIQRIQELMERESYITDRAIATTVFLATELHKPVLIEGPAGVGKTEVAKVLASALGTRLIRLQCYEGLDVNTALYEWNFPKQMLRMKIEESGALSTHEKEQLIFSEAFLFKRPLLEAITEPDRSPVLLIDEIDRADEEFEAFLLEVLSDFQVTIPELGTVAATHRPYVALTSNRTRELSDALKRRCLYLWIEYPSFDKEARIIEAKVPGISTHLAEQIAGFMQVARRLKLSKVPGVAETLDWAVSMMALHQDHLEPEAVSETLGCLLKDREDIVRYAGPRIQAIVEALSALPSEALPDAGERVLASLDGAASVPAQGRVL